MAENYKEVVSLKEDLPESSYSGLSSLPEVKDPMSWLMGTKSRGEFRSMILDDVIPERKEIPEWAKTVDYKTTGEKIIEKTGVLSEGIVGGESTDLNKTGEFFYSTKDGFADFFSSMPRQIGTYIAARAKKAGVAPETSTKALEYFDDLKKDSQYEKALRDFRLGVDPDAFTNQMAAMFGNMAGLITTAVVTGGSATAGIIEGLQEGGSYLETDISAQRERPGGLSEYKGEGLEFATIQGIISGLVGLKGVEAKFTDSLGKFTGKQIVEGSVSELATEGIQQGFGLLSREVQNRMYGTDTDKKTPTQGVLEIGKAMLMGGLGGAAFGGIAYVNNVHYMAEVLQENFGLTKADAKMLARQYMELSADAVSRNGRAMKELSPESRTMQLAKQQLVYEDGMDGKEADRVLSKIRRDVIKEQAKKGEELSANEFFDKVQTPEELAAYVRDKAGVKVAEDSVVEEEKQKIADRRVELEAQQAQEEQKAETTAAEETSVQTTEETVAEEQKIEEKPTEKPVTEEKSSPVQLEMNFLNAQENAINKAMDIEAPELPVNQNLLTKQDVQKINDKLEEIETKVDDLSVAKTPAQKEEYDAGKQLNSFVKPKTAVSKFSERVAKQTGTEGVGPVRHSVRDMASAKKDADALVNTNEDAAWEILENERADTKGLLKSEVAEALKRKISKIKDANTRKEQLRRLINAYADVATRLGQEFRALADDSLVDAIRDAAMIEAKVSKKIEKAVKNKSAKVQKTIDNLVKSDRVMSDKRFWEQVREKMECR